MRFGVHGPIEVPLNEFSFVRKPEIRFWRETVDTLASGLSEARGCYVFAINSSGSRRLLPCYVGRTTNASFRNECFGAHQINLYNNALAGYKRRRAWVYLLPRLTNRGRFYRGNAPALIENLEYYLISLALRQNKDLENIRDTKFFRETYIPGILNPRKEHPGGAAVSLKSTLGL
jgi:hypothetical protein